MIRQAIFACWILAILCGRASAQTSPSQPTSRTYETELKVDRSDLQKVLETLYEKIGVPIEIVQKDFQLNGITKCQSIGFDEPKQPVEELLKKILRKAMPDDKLVYTVKPNALGVETVYICVRRDAEKRGETLFPEFNVVPPQWKPIGPIHERKPIAIVPDHGWSSLIRPATLEEEIRRQIAALGKALQSKEPGVPARAAVVHLAALFNIIDQYDAEARWKSEARAVCRELATNRPPRGVWNDETRRRIVALHADLLRLLANDKWPRAAAATTPVTWPQAIPRPEIMRRFERACNDRFATRSGTRESDVSDGAAIAHEAEIIAALAHVIQDPGYDFASEAEYAGHAKSFEAQARLVFAAGLGDDDPDYLQRVIGRLRTKCNQCHASFR